MECWDGPGLPALNMMQHGRTEDLCHRSKRFKKCKWGFIESVTVVDENNNNVNLGVVAQPACTRCSSSTPFLCQGSQTQYGEQLQRLRRLLYEADRLVLAGFTGTPILSEPWQRLVLRSK